MANAPGIDDDIGAHDFREFAPRGEVRRDDRVQVLELEAGDDGEADRPAADHQRRVTLVMRAFSTA